MLTLQMRPELSQHALVPSRESGPTIDLPRGTMSGLSIMALPPSDYTDPGPSPSKRPKLSLQTSTLPLTRAKSTTSLTPSSPTDSPTLRNTHLNAYQARRRSATSSPSTPSQRSTRARTASPVRPQISPFRKDTPYKLPLGVRGILRNSPRPRRLLSATSARTPRRMFPDPKHVSYRSPLEVVMSASIYLSDIDEEAEGEGSSNEIGDKEETESEARESIVGRESTRGSKRNEEALGTVARGRRKRRREWEWTLEPIEPVNPDNADLHRVMESTSASDLDVFDSLPDGEAATVREVLTDTGNVVNKEHSIK